MSEQMPVRTVVKIHSAAVTENVGTDTTFMSFYNFVKGQGFVVFMNPARIVPFHAITLLEDVTPTGDMTALAMMQPGGQA